MNTLKEFAKKCMWGVIRPFHREDFWPMKVISGPSAGAKLMLDIRVNGAYWLGTYDRWILDHLDLARWLSPGNVAWDCGSYLGYYAAAFRNAVGPNGAVEVFEASSENYARLARVPAINGWNNVRVHHLAVGSDHSEIEFAGGLGGASGPAGTSKLIPPGAMLERVRCCGIDELCLERHIREPDFIKFDLETAEEFALHNGSKLFSKKRPVLLLEIHGEAVLPAVGRFFKQYDYQGWNILEFDFEKAMPLLNEMDLRTRSTSNTIVCLPRERERL